MTWLILTTLLQTNYKNTKNCTKTLVFITLGTSKLKKIDDYENIYSVNFLYLITGKVDIFIV